MEKNQTLSKKYVDFIYGVQRKKKKYLEGHPTEKILVADGSKGIQTGKEESVQMGIQWVFAQRAVILLTNKKIISGKWTIPLDQISKAELIHYSPFSNGQVLKIKTKGNQFFQFGMQKNPEWNKQKALPLKTQEQNAKYSLLSTTIRLAAMAYLFYLCINILMIRL